MNRWATPLRYLGHLASTRPGRYLWLAVLLCLSLWLARSPLTGLVLRDLALPAAERLAPGLKLDFKALRTNLVSRLELTGVTVSYHPPDDHQGQGLRLVVPRLTIGYTLPGLFPWPGPAAILPRLRLDLDRPTLAGTIPASQAAMPLLPTLAALPEVKAQNAALDLRLPGMMELNGQRAEIEVAALSAPDQTGQGVKILLPTLSVAGPAWPTLRGKMRAHLVYGPGRIEMPALSFNETPLISQGRLDTDLQGLHFSLVLHLLQSQGLVKGSLTREAARLAFHVKDCDLAAALKAAGEKTGVGGRLRADGELAMRPGHPDTLTGSVSALVRDGSWNGRKIERLEVAAQAGGQRLAISRLDLTSGASQLNLQDVQTPLSWRPSQGWRTLMAASRGRVRLNLDDFGLLPAGWLDHLLDDWQSLHPKEAHADLVLDRGRLTINDAEVWGGFGRARLTGGQADLSGPPAAWEEAPMSGAWRLDLTDAGLVRRFWPDWPATGGEAHGQGSFSGSLAKPKLPLTATFLKPRLYGLTLDQVTGRLLWTLGRLDLDLTADQNPDNHLRYQGAIDLQRGALLDTKVTARLAELKSCLPPALTPGLTASGSLTGELGLAGPFTRLSGQGQASGDLRVAGISLRHADLNGGFTGRNWDIQRLQATVGPGVDLDLGGRLTITPDHGLLAELDQASLAWQGQRLTLSQAAALKIAPHSLTVPKPLLLGGDLGQFQLNGGLGDGDQLTLTASQVRDTGLIRRWLGRDLGFAGLDFTLTLAGQPATPAWRWQGTVRGLGLPGQSSLSLSGPFDLAGDEDGLAIRRCHLAGDQESIELSGNLPLLIVGGKPIVKEAGPLTLKAGIALPPGGLLPGLFPEWLAKSGATRADIDLSGSLASPHGQVRLAAEDLSPGPRLSLLPNDDFSANVLVEFDADRLTLPRLELSSPQLGLAAHGRLRQISLADLLKGGAGRPGQVELKGRFSLPDLRWLSGKWPSVRRVGGQLAGAFRLDGPLAKPKIEAELSLKNGAARYGDSLLVFRDLKLDAALRQDQLNIAAFSGLMGGAPVRGSGQIVGLFGADPQLAAHLTGQNLLLYRTDGVKLRADASLTLAGSERRPDLSGDLTLTDSRIDRRVDWLTLLKPGGRKPGEEGLSLFSFKDPPLNNATLNLRIRASRPVEIANNVFRGEVRPDLVLLGTGELPYLRGLIYADHGRITLPPGRLDLETGIIRFPEDEPDRPQLELQASGQLQGYQVNAQVNGPYSEPEVTLSSSPALASEDLMMLILTGKRPATAGQPNANGRFSTAAVYLSRGLLSRLFSGAEGPSLLDQVEVDVGRSVTPQGDPTVDARVKLAEGLGKKKDTSLYLSGEKDTWDYYDAGLRMVFRFR